MNRHYLRGAMRTIRYITRWYTSPARRAGRPDLPTTLSLMATDNCNAKCVMCDVWKTKADNELTPRELGEILRDPLFSGVEHVGISGGEPTLRKDLPEIVAEIVFALPALLSLSITSHGFHTARWRAMAPVIQHHCARRQVEFRVNISLDGIEDLHNEVRGLRKAFVTTRTTIDTLRAKGVSLQLQSTITAPNLYGIGRTLAWAMARDLDVVFRQGTVITRLDNRDSVQSVSLAEDQRSFLADFLRSERLNSFTKSPARRLFYADLSERLISGRVRNAPCIFQNEGVVLAANGDMFHCSISEEAFGNARGRGAYEQYFSEKSEELRRYLISNVCPGCVHDQSGVWPPAKLIRHSLSRNATLKKLRWLAEAGPVAAGLFGRSIIARSRSSMMARPLSEGPLGKVIVIGAYGGEHVGDAAILGGVLKRLHAVHGVGRAKVASIRSDRTRRWVNAIHSPVDLEVFDYEDEEIRQHLETADALVLAGGPLMDLPKLLNKHLRSTLAAKRLGKPFLVEGIGIGPFKNRLTRLAGRSILELADSIVVRSDRDNRSSLLNGLRATYRQDPAFDYLATRGDTLQLEFGEARSLGRLLEGLEGKLLVGVNLRPLWGKYVPKGVDMDALSSRFTESLADGLRRLDEALEGRLAVLSFPMNSDQYGFSDLGAGQLLDEHLNGYVEHRIWEYEPGIDAVLKLLRRLDAVIAMRFHACIFSISQGVPTLGIDYNLGSRGKVGSLMVERGLGDSVVKLDKFRPEWVAERLENILRDKVLAIEMESLPRDSLVDTRISL